MKLIREKDILKNELKISNLISQNKSLQEDLSYTNYELDTIRKHNEQIGTAFVVTKTGAIFSLGNQNKIEKAEKVKESQRLSEANVQWSYEKNLALKPFDPIKLLNLYDECPLLYRTIKQIATDVAGLGYELSLKEGRKESKVEKRRIEAFIESPSEESVSLRSITDALLIDLALIGYSGLEVTRGKANQVDKIFHIPSSSLWVHIEGKKYCEKIGNKSVWWKKYTKKNTEPNIDSKTGDPYDETNKEHDKANEMYFIKNYYPKSQLYGAPPLIPAIGQIISMIGIRDYNLSFFENLGIPAYLVTLTGKWDDKASEEIHNFIDTELKGAENANKTLVLQLPSGGEANFTPVSTQGREGSFRLYLDSLKEDVLAVYSMPSYRLGIAVVGKLSGTTARELNEIYKNGVVEPIQCDIEKLFNNIIRSDTYTFKFKDLDTEDEQANLSLETQMLNTGRKTINELNHEKALPEIKEDFANFHYISRSLIPLEFLKEQHDLSLQSAKASIAQSKLRKED